MAISGLRECTNVDPVFAVNSLYYLSHRSQDFFRYARGKSASSWIKASSVPLK